MRRITAILLFSLLFACKHSDNSEQLKEQLKKTMVDFLYKNNHVDSSQVTYQINKVMYVENKKDYVCTFEVHMRDKNFDTTGIISARISKDLTQVFRRN